MSRTGSVTAGTVNSTGSASATFTIEYKVGGVTTNAPETYTFTLSSIHESGTAIFTPASPITMPSGTSSVTFKYNNTKVGGSGVSNTHEIQYSRASGSAVANGNVGTATTTINANSSNKVLLTGPATMVATSSGTFTLTLNDAFDNVTNAVGNTSFTITTSDSPGTATITAAQINAGTSTTTFTYQNSTVGDGSHLITATRAAGDALANASDNRSITVTPGTRNKLIISSVTPSSSPVAGTAATVTAQVADVFNNPVSDNTISINWSKDNPNVTLSEAGGLSDATGKRSVSVTTPSTVTTTIITATEAGGVGLGTVTQTITSVAGTAASMALHAGNTQTATVATAVTTKPAVILKDANNNVKSGVTVTFTTSNPGGSVSHATTTTDAAGIASTTWTLGTVAGAQTLTAASTGLANITFSATAHAAAANKLVVTAPNLTPAPSSSQTISAQITDTHGNAVASSTLTINWTKSSADGTLSPTTSITDASGVATTTFTAHSVAGTIASITAAGGALTSGTSSNTTVATVGAATALHISTAPVAGTASGATLATQPVIHIRDNSGNLVTSANNTVTVSVTPGTGTLGGTVSVAAVNGVATFTNLTLAGLVGTNYQLAFSAAGLTSATSGNLTVTFGAANKLAVSTAPVAGSSGSALTTQPVIHIQDAQGNLVTNNTSQVGINITAGTGGTLGGTTVVNAVGGVATFSGITLTGTPGASYTLGFTSTPTFTTTSHVVTLAAGSATQLFVSQAPVAGASGAVFPTQPVIQIRDSGGTLVNTATHTISVSSSGGTLIGTTTQPAVAGVATFTNLGLTGTPGSSYTLSFTSTPALTTVTSTVTIATTAGTATKLAITTQPVGAANQAVLAAQPVIEIQDANGLRVTTATNTVTVSVTPNTGTTAGTLGGTLSVAAVNGVATFAGLTLSGLVGTNYTLAFASGSLTPANSNAVSLTGPAGASKLAIDRQPVGGVSNQLFPTQPIIHIQDAQGNRVTNSSATVTAALLAGSGSGTLLGAKDATASNGIATFTNLYIDGPSTVSYTIQFTSGSLTSVTSNNINLSSLPTVSTATVTAITSSSATLGGNVTDQGTSALTQKGVCYSTTTNPTLNASGSTCLVSAGTNTGAFTVPVSGLTLSTTYYVRAYATNTQGTAYGSNVTFTTTALENPVPVVTSITPDAAAPGQTVNVTISGANFVTGATIPSMTGITVTDVSRTSATTLTANFAVATGAQIGARTVKVTNPTPGGGESTTSAVFNVALAAPSPNSTKWPTGSLVSTSSTPTFDWNAVSGAVNYDLQVSNQANFTQSLACEINCEETQANTFVQTYSNITGITFTVPSPLPVGFTYFWRIRANTSSIKGVWSNAISFQVIAPPLPPALISPSNGAIGVTGPVAFQWTPTNFTSSYHIQISTSVTFTTLYAEGTGLPSAVYTLPVFTSGNPVQYFWRVRSIGIGGTGEWSSVSFFTRAKLTSDADEGAEIPSTYSLEQNYPNPFNPSTNIRFGLPETAPVTLEVYNLQGQKVAVLLQNVTKSAGMHTLSFDASKLSSGIYVYRIMAGSTFMASQKMVLLK